MDRPPRQAHPPRQVPRLAPHNPLATPWPGPPPETPPDNVEEVNVAGRTSTPSLRCGMNCYVVSHTPSRRIPTGYWDAQRPQVRRRRKEAREEHNGKFIANRGSTRRSLKPHTTKSMFKVEYKDGAIKRFKARIVACGYSQTRPRLDRELRRRSAPTASGASAGRQPVRVRAAGG